MRDTFWAADGRPINADSASCPGILEKYPEWGRLCFDGKVDTTGDMDREAIRLLERHEREHDDALANLRQRLQRGAEQAERNELLDGDVVFDELKEMIEERRQASRRSPGIGD